jgi:hypothetical protein
VSATLIGRDGSAVGLSGQGAEVTVPIGEYRVGTLTFALEDPGGGPKWCFIFSDNGGKPDHTWYEVEKGGSVEIDPIGKLEMQVGLASDAKPPRAGADIVLEPKLYTGGGLLINTCFRGSPVSPASEQGPGPEIKLSGTDGQPLAAARSGFA